MAIDKIAGVAGAGGGSPAQPVKQSFAEVAKSTTSPKAQPGPQHAAQSHAQAQRAQAPIQRAEAPAQVRPQARLEAGGPALATNRTEAARVTDRVLQAQQKLEKILDLAQSGKTFTPAELIALQAHVYSASQEIDLAGKVVDKATGGLKTLLQTPL